MAGLDSDTIAELEFWGYFRMWPDQPTNKKPNQ